jgi:hypothetical protein
MKTAVRLPFAARAPSKLAGLYESSSAARAAAAVVQSEGHLSERQIQIVEPFDPHYVHLPDPERFDFGELGLRALFTAGAAGFVAGCLVFSALRSAGWISATTTPGMAAILVVGLGTLFGLLLGGLFVSRPDPGALSAPVREAVGAGRWAVVAAPVSPTQAKLAMHALYRTSHHVLRTF